MIIGLILVGSLLGGFAGVGALILGFSIWSALLIYICVGTSCVLALAVSLALRPDPQERTKEAKRYALVGQQGG